MVALVGPLATTGSEPRQARKGATVIITSCAGMWLARVATQFCCMDAVLLLIIPVPCLADIFVYNAAKFFQGGFS